MDFQPSLQNEIVQVRPLEKTDFQELYKHANDPTVWEQSPDGAKNRYTIEGFENFFNKMLGTGTAFCIVDRKTNLPIGITKYYMHKKVLFIGGSFLGKQYWGGQYNFAFNKLMIDHAFEHFDVIHYSIPENNLRSRRAYIKIGFHEAGSEEFNINGKRERCIIHRHFKKDWNN